VSGRYGGLVCLIEDPKQNRLLSNAGGVGSEKDTLESRKDIRSLRVYRVDMIVHAG